MPQLEDRQLRDLRDILRNLEWAQSYLERQDVQIVQTHATITYDFASPEEKQEMCKRMVPIDGLVRGTDQLVDFLSRNS